MEVQAWTRGEIDQMLSDFDDEIVRGNCDYHKGTILILVYSYNNGNDETKSYIAERVRNLGITCCCKETFDEGITLNVQPETRDEILYSITTRIQSGIPEVSAVLPEDGSAKRHKSSDSDTSSVVG